MGLGTMHYEALGAEEVRVLCAVLGRPHVAGGLTSLDLGCLPALPTSSVPSRARERPPHPTPPPQTLTRKRTPRKRNEIRETRETTTERLERQRHANATRFIQVLDYWNIAARLRLDYCIIASTLLYDYFFITSVLLHCGSYCYIITTSLLHITTEYYYILHI
jgi:hypothetical protein